MRRGTYLIAVCGLLPASAALVAGQPPGPDGIVTVRASDAESDARLGFVADAAGHVIAHVDADGPDGVAGETFVVRVSTGDEYPAQGVAYDVRSRLGLLEVDGPLPMPYPFATDRVEQGRLIYGAAIDDTGAIDIGPGSITDVRPASGSDPAAPDTIRHNALVGRRMHGSPLFNNCGEVSGAMVEYVVPPTSVSGSEFAVPADWLIRTFGEHGLEPTLAGEPCPSEAARLEAAVQERDRLAAALEDERREREERERERERAEEAAAAERERERAEEAAAAERERERAEEAAAAERERERAQEETAAARASERAQEETAAARASAARAAEEAAAAERERERAQEETAAAQRYVMWAVAAGGTLSVVLMALWVASRRSQARAARDQAAAEAAAESARTAMATREASDRLVEQVPDVLLTGVDGDGLQIALRVPGRAIAEPSGAVVGRNPFDGAIVLNHEEVSRRHFRVFARDGSLRVEDLGSMNGTALDGAALEAGASKPLRSGARLHVGNLEFTVRLSSGK